ncbi:MAG TPA: amidase [Ktedonobacterales bacterium]|jgi:aspartyl-tRNA(Asn)/glutamyl-tRNA(Gln) amidotransferase subunit A
MAGMDEIATLTEASEKLYAEEISAVELTEQCLARIAAVDDRVRAFVTVTRERALADARNADALLEVERHGETGKLGATPPVGLSGPLAGIPIALKDLIATRGIRTTAGSRVLADHVPDADAPIVGYLAAAGAVLLGKTNTHEFAYGTFTPPTRNPWDLARVPGGSSGGSAAAVAAGECLGAIGTDTGGSIRIPAACCGVTGFKPTYGLVDATGVIPLSWSLDHVGPIARSVADCALLLDGLVNGELCEPLRPIHGALHDGDMEPMHFVEAVEDSLAIVGGLRLGVPSNYFFAHVEPEIEAAVRAAIRVLAALGAVVEEVRVPAAVDDLFEVYRAVQRPEATTAHTDAGWWPAQAERYLPATRAALARGADYTAADYIRAQRARQAFEREMEALFDRVDVLVTPTLPLVAPRVADVERPLLVAGREEEATVALLRLTFPFDMSGQPALTVPCGFSDAGLPIGLQLVGRRFDEVTVLRMGQAYQRDTNWHLRRPALG